MRCRNPLFSLERWAPNVRRGTTPRLKPGAFSLHPGVWTTTTRTSRMACCAPQCGHPARIRSASVSILRRGLSPTTPYRNFRRPVWVCTPNGGDLTPRVVHIKGRAFLPSFPSPKGALKGGASRVGDGSASSGGWRLARHSGASEATQDVDE